MKNISANGLIVSASLAFAALSLSSAYGAGFALQENSISGLGNSFAGGAAVAEDASTVFFNPAGMARIEGRQLVSGFHLVLPDAKFSNDGTTTFGAPTQGGNSLSEEEAVIPNLFVVTPLGEDLKFGLGVSAPFGLATDYDAEWVGRYIARKSELKSVNVNPSIAYRVDSKLSIGVGASYMRAEAELSNAIDFGLAYLNAYQAGAIPLNDATLALAGDAQANLGGTKYDGGVELQGDDTAWGWNVGLLFEFKESTRVGAHYRSQVDLTLKGNADFTIGAMDPFFSGVFNDQSASVDLTLPETYAISLYHDFGNRWALMGDVTRTGWSSFQYLAVDFSNPVTPDSVAPELWEDVNRYSLGATFSSSDTLLWRAGVSHDQSPVPSDTYRSPRIPDEDRTWLTFGVSIKTSDAMQLDFSYLHVFVDDPVIDNDTHLAGQHLVGSIDAKVDLFRAGLKWSF